MPSQACAAFGCPNNSRKTVGVSYFRPRNDIIKQNWVKACPNGMKEVKNFYICSEHFHRSEKKTIGSRISLLDHATTPTIWKFPRWYICIQSFQKQSFFYYSLCPSVCSLSANSKVTIIRSQLYNQSRLQAITWKIAGFSSKLPKMICLKMQKTAVITEFKTLIITIDHIPM